ncbi:MAG: Gfo/Idh/MocA family protein [Alphaproteobacteria bacterium]
MKKIRIGLIGLGEVAQLMHIPALNHLQNYFEIKAVSDISPSLIEYIQNRYHIPYGFDNAKDVIEHDEVDAVIILSPDQLHGQHAKYAIDAQKPVLLEKPACLLASEAEELAHYAKVKQAPVMIGYMRCYTRAFNLAKEHLINFGDITHIRTFDLQREGPYFFNQVEEPFVPSDLSKNAIIEAQKIELQNREAIIGKDAPDLLWKCYRVLTGAAIHNFAVLRNLIGSPENVLTASYSKGGENINAVLDYGNFTCLYEIVIDNIARVDAYVQVMGEYKDMKLCYDTPYIRNLPTKLILQNSSEDSNEHIIKGPYYDDPFQKELLHFYDVIVHHTPIQTPIKDAVLDIQLAEKILDKLRTYF